MGLSNIHIFCLFKISALVILIKNKKHTSIQYNHTTVCVIAFMQQFYK